MPQTGTVLFSKQKLQLHKNPLLTVRYSLQNPRFNFKSKSMKKFFYLFLAVVLIMTTASVAKSQVVRFRSDSTGAVYDTTSGSSTESQYAVFNGTGKSVAVQVMWTRLSGTAAGTMYLYASNDGSNYVATGDSATISNAASGGVLLKTFAPLPWLYLKVVYAGSGTMSVKWNTTAMYRRE